MPLGPLKSLLALRAAKVFILWQPYTEAAPIGLSIIMISVFFHLCLAVGPDALWHVSALALLTGPLPI